MSESLGVAQCTGLCARGLCPIYVHGLKNTAAARRATHLSHRTWRIMDWGHLAPFSDLFPSFIDGRQISRGRICRRVVWWKQRKQHAETTETTETTRVL
eukprot:scaffold9383_cov61-Skeletonema_menzelii.AAC.1